MIVEEANSTLYRHHDKGKLEYDTWTTSRWKVAIIVQGGKVQTLSWKDDKNFAAE